MKIMKILQDISKEKRPKGEPMGAIKEVKDEAIDIIVSSLRTTNKTIHSLENVLDLTNTYLEIEIIQAEVERKAAEINSKQALKRLEKKE